MSWIEIAGTVTALACVYFTVKEKMINWPIGVVNILIYMYMFFQARLYASFALQVVFLVLQIYGWWYWSRERGRREVRPTTRGTRLGLLLALAVGAAGTLAVGRLLVLQTDAAVPYWDSIVLSFSLVAQWFLGRKVLENWLFWNGVDVISVVIYATQGLYLTSLTYAVFLYLAARGYIEWKRQMAMPSPAEV